MKRTFLFLLTAILLGAGLCSCEKDDNGENNSENNNGGNNGGGGNGGGTATVQWVDLGLPSGLLWADRNVGAASPEDYGNYYAWGETKPKESGDWWSNYVYGNASTALTKYCSKSYFGLNGFTDNLTTLEASDDAATVNLGGGAHTPRDYEWQELMDNTTSQWTTRNGVCGRRLTASNGKSIFLPATGIYDGLSLDYANVKGCYWSSTLYVGTPIYACCLGFDSGGQRMGSSYRFNGLSVRAVRAK